MSNEIPSGTLNLAEAELGAQALWATDDFFAPKERMLARADPISRPGVFDDNGQWMDGWESRRRRGGGHDTCVVRLAWPGEIRMLDLDTRYFTGNYPPHASVEALPSGFAGDPLDAAAPWTTLLPRSALTGNSHNRFAVGSKESWQFLRLHLFPDGGIARLRAWGVVRPDWSRVPRDRVLDLFAIENGGAGLCANDEHYGSIRNLNRPGRGINMGDGWETRRRREPGNDWAIVRLGHPGVIEEVEVDTAHFRGNYPDRVSLQAALIEGSDAALELSSRDWPLLLAEQKLQAHAQHRFRSELVSLGPVSHVRVNIYPDGGVSRLRLFGKVFRP